MLFILISDIDKNYRSWYEWIPYNSKQKMETDFVSELQKMGKIFIPKPNFVNFRKYAKYDNNNGYDGDIYFKIEDLYFETYADWIYDQIPEKDRLKFIVIGLEQGCHQAKFFANRYSRNCVGVFILGDRILSKENYEKLWNVEKYYTDLKEQFGEKWENYKIHTLNNERLSNLLDKLKTDTPDTEAIVAYLNGFVKGFIRSQYNKVKSTLVPAFMYSYKHNMADEKQILNKKFESCSTASVTFIDYDQDADYLIYSKYKNDILEQIKQVVNANQKGGDYKNKYIKYKTKYLALKKQIGGNNNEIKRKNERGTKKSNK